MKKTSKAENTKFSIEDVETASRIADEMQAKHDKAQDEAAFGPGGWDQFFHDDEGTQENETQAQTGLIVGMIIEKGIATSEAEKKPVTRTEALAKASRMYETAKSLEKVEDVTKQLNEFELGREGQEAVIELTNKKGQSFKTSNSYLIEKVMAVLKSELTEKASSLEEELKKLY